MSVSGKSRERVSIQNGIWTLLIFVKGRDLSMFKYWKGTRRNGENENTGQTGVNIWALKRWER